MNTCRGDETAGVACAGDDWRTPFITESESGSILEARMPVAGGLPFSHTAR